MERHLEGQTSEDKPLGCHPYLLGSFVQLLLANFLLVVLPREHFLKFLLLCVQRSYCLRSRGYFPSVHVYENKHKNRGDAWWDWWNALSVSISSVKIDPCDNLLGSSGPVDYIQHSHYKCKSVVPYNTCCNSVRRGQLFRTSGCLPISLCC